MTKYLLILSTLLSVSTYNLAYAEKSAPDKQRESVIDDLLASKLFVDFPRSSFNQEKELNSYSCDFKGESYKHPEGVFGSDSIWFSTPLEQKDFKNFILISETDYRVMDDDVRFLTPDECLEKATEIKKLLWPKIEFPSGVAAAPEISNSDYSVGIRWRFYEPTKLLRRMVSLSIRKVDGKCTYLTGGEYKWLSDSRKSGFAVPYQEALNTANQFLKSQGGNADAILKSWTVNGNWGDFYVFNYQLADKTITVFVSSKNGKAMSALPKREKSNVNGDDLAYSKYGQAHWTRRGLVFTSTRFRQSFDGRKLYPKIILRDLEGKFSVIYNVSNSNPRIIFSAPWSDWIVIRGGYTFAINLANGQIKSLESSDTASILDVELSNNGVTPSITNKLPLAVIQASSGSKGQSRLWLDSLTTPSSKASRQVLNWNDSAIPHFSPDGKYVYLFRPSYELTNKPSTLIRRMDVKTFLSSATKTNFNVVKESVQVHRVANHVVKLQPYPEGNQLFISTEEYHVPAYLLDLKTHKETALTTKAILQKNTAQLSGVWNIYAGPKAGEITIYASTKKKVEQLFVCNLDGSNLRALTPTQELAAKYTNFPSGKSGFDVSKAIALHLLTTNS